MDAAYAAWILWAIFGLAVLLVPLMAGELAWTLAGTVIWWVVLNPFHHKKSSWIMLASFIKIIFTRIIFLLRSEKRVFFERYALQLKRGWFAF